MRSKAARLVGLRPDLPRRGPLSDATRDRPLDDQRGEVAALDVVAPLGVKLGRGRHRIETPGLLNDRGGQRRIHRQRRGVPDNHAILEPAVMPRIRLIQRPLAAPRRRQADERASGRREPWAERPQDLKIPVGRVPVRPPVGDLVADDRRERAASDRRLQGRQDLHAGTRRQLDPLLYVGPDECGGHAANDGAGVVADHARLAGVTREHPDHGRLAGGHHPTHGHDANHAGNERRDVRLARAAPAHDPDLAGGCRRKRGIGAETPPRQCRECGVEPIALSGDDGQGCAPGRPRRRAEAERVREVSESRCQHSASGAPRAETPRPRAARSSERMGP